MTSLPLDEQQRLRALRLYGVLDTQAEQFFDDLVRLAATACAAPVSLLSFVDEDRQWIKAAAGQTRGQVARDISLCAQALMEPDMLVVADTLADGRFAGNPLVTSDPGIRFYAGCPLVTSDGLPIGTLCVFDRSPRQPEPEQLQSLRLLARAAMAQLELRKQLESAAAPCPECQRRTAVDLEQGSPAGR